MELRHLRYFVAVAEEESITRAAARLHVSQPPLSRQIRDLEEELGVGLFERQARSVALTPAGHRFLRDARRILALTDQAMARVRNATRPAGGELRVGYSPTPTAELLPRALELFRSAAPAGRVLLLDLSTDEMIAAVKGRKLDLGLFARPLGMKWDRLEFRKLFELAVGIIVPPGHRFARRAAVALDEALEEPIVAYIRRGYSDYHGWLASVFKRGTRKPRLLLSADGAASLVAGVVSGQGIAFGLPTFESSFGKRIRYVPLSTPVPGLEVGVLRRRETASPLVAYFLDALEAAAKRLPPPQ